ncbi:MAG: hypothetical protein KDB10_20350, partial [Acidimicrobiales bacterium]|nr:hypothetical protein [Acidimicrobiales bacterium]
MSGTGDGAADDDDRSRPKGLWLLLGALLVCFVVAAGALLVLALDGDDAESAEGLSEIYLQPAGDPGPDPFMVSIALAKQDEALKDPRPTAPANDVEVRSVPGSRPGLFGGTENQSTCDREQLVEFLTDPVNRAKGEAWAAVHEITVDDIADYVDGLTPLRLRFDTRVTNHGFRDDRATPFQAVLEAGTAVLVDEYGVPRARCACGNPLLPPAAQANAEFVGDPWDGFEPSLLKTVSAEDLLTEFVVTKIKADQTSGTGKYLKPVGTDGEADGPLETTTTTTSTTTVPAATTTTPPVAPPTTNVRGSIWDDRPPSGIPAPPLPAGWVTQSIGTSVLGREITLLHRPVENERVRVVVIGAVHGNEPVDPPIVRALVDVPLPADVEVWLVPEMNPDGVAA